MWINFGQLRFGPFILVLGQIVHPSIGMTTFFTFTCKHRRKHFPFSIFHLLFSIFSKRTRSVKAYEIPINSIAAILWILFFHMDFGGRGTYLLAPLSFALFLSLSLSLSLFLKIDLFSMNSVNLFSLNP